MSDITYEAHEVARSRDVFMDPETYQGFDLTTDHRRIVGCIDPRDEERDHLQVIVQTPGGAAGKGLDASLALTAFDNGERVYTIDDGLHYDSELQRATVAGAHQGCRFILGLADVLAEMTAPQDITTDTERGLISRYGLKDTGVEKRMRAIADAAMRQQEEITKITPDTLLGTVNTLYPLQQNIVAMRGENRAGFYILNHHPWAGLNRARVHRGENPLRTQAYHDNVRASKDSLEGTVGMPPEVKLLRLAALLRRTAATRTVLCADQPNMEYLNVVPAPRGLQVEQDYF
jgi:hypothetical protein